LVIDGSAGLLAFAMNEQPQAVPSAEGIACFDITALLRPRNFIELTLAGDGRRGDVRLEIGSGG
jgi:hypothetical protein